MQAKGRLQCWNADSQELGGSCREGCAGKGQAATLEQQRRTARLGGSCREGIGGFSGVDLVRFFALIGGASMF